MRKLIRKAASALCAGMLAFSLVPAGAMAAWADETQSAPAPRSAGASPAGDDGGVAVPGEVLVAYSKEQPGFIRTLGRSFTLFSYGAEQTDAVDGNLADADRIVKLEVPEERVDDFIEAMRGEPGVEWVQRNFKYRLFDEPSAGVGEGDGSTGAAEAVIVNDPATSQQYYLDSWEESHGANVRAAWAEAKAQRSVTVAILDTGIRADHEDLAPNIDTAHMIDVFSGDAVAGQITDLVGHGTHVAGIAAGVTDNGIGVAGASYNATILPIKVFNNMPGNYSGTESIYLLKAYAYLSELMDKGELTDLHVINMSLGGYAYLDETDYALEQAIAAMNDRGVMTVCAGGNGDENGNAYTIASYPSDFEECLAVTALGKDGNNTKWSDYNSYKDISAPGEDLYSTYYSSANGYVAMSGTSMASPLVAGIAALMWSANPDLTVDEAKDIICTEAAIGLDPNGANYHNATQTGSAGAIDALAAVRAAKNGADLSKKYLSRAVVALEADTFLADGTEKTPAITVTYGDTELVEGQDYDVSYADNVEVGTARIVLTGKGDYLGRTSATFKIVNDIADGGFMRSIAAKQYTGNAIEPSVVVVWRNKTLTRGADYTVSYEDNILPGTAKVIIRGTGSFGGSFTGTFTIKGEVPDQPENPGAGTDQPQKPGTEQPANPGSGSGSGDELIGDDNTPLAPGANAPGSVTVYIREKSDSQKYLAKVVESSQIQSMARSGSVSSQYIKSTDAGPVWQVWTATSYVTLSDVLNAAGVGSLWNAEASLTYGTRNRVQTYTYDRMVNDSWYFPAANTVGPNTQGAQQVAPVLALSAGKTEVTSTAAVAVQENIRKATPDNMPMMLFGSSWDEFVNGQCYGRQYWTDLDTLTLVVPDGKLPEGLQPAVDDEGNPAPGEESGEGGDGEEENPYKDVPIDFDDIASTHWLLTTPADDAGIYLRTMVGKGLMKGYGGTKSFGPDDRINRAQVATILYRAANPDDNATTDPAFYATSSNFPDVNGGSYYTAAINWCQANGIVSGDGATGEFKPFNAVTREQLAKMISGYAAKMGNLDITHATMESLNGMADRTQCANWAVPYLAWCTDAGIMTGSAAADGTRLLNPKSTATRAQMCKMMTLTLNEVTAAGKAAAQEGAEEA